MATDHTFLRIEVDPSGADLDIVVIHGLNPSKKESNAYSTWTAEKKKAQRNWIKDKEFLPKLLPKARIMVFGYNSHAVFRASEANINDHASSLLAALWQKRRKTALERPLMFICHSMGGLLAKRALIVAALPSSTYGSIFTATRGMVFFATPHGGSGKVPVGQIATRIATSLKFSRDNAFMEALNRNSLCGETTRKDYNNICHNIHIISFQETLPTAGVMVVDKADAVCGLPSDRETALTVNANHSDVCKFFDPQGDDYISVSEQIEELAEKVLKDSANATVAPPTVPTRRNTLYFVPYQTNTKFQGRSTELEYIEKFYSSDDGEPKSSRRLILQGFPGIGKTSIAIQFAASQTNCYDGIFWVTANTKENVAFQYAEMDKRTKESSGETFSDWCRNHTWLLVVDNLDDPTFFNPMERIPIGPGHVLITSRRTNLVQLGTLYKIPPLSQENAVSLLLSYAEGRTPEEEEESYALAITQLLDCVPLAIRHCGCAVSAQGGLLSSYVLEFDQLMEELVLPEELEDTLDTFDLHEAKPILATFELSFSQVKRYRPEAAAILEIFANMDPTDVSLPMLSRCLDENAHWDGKGNATVSHQAGMASWLVKLRKKTFGKHLPILIKELVTYSLLFSKAQDGAYFLHPMTHFFLRWRQDRILDVHPFCTSVFFLLNGFPHPDFSRIYGLSNEHLHSRDMFMHHVRHMNKRFERILDNLEEDEGVLVALATLFLHASNVPKELQPAQEWRENPLWIAYKDRSNIPDEVKAKLKALGSYVDVYTQDTTLLPSIELIITKLGYPSFLFFQAMYVFFHHISTTWLARNPTSGFNISHLSFAGQSLEAIRQRTLDLHAPMGPNVMPILAFGGETFDNQIYSLCPLLYKLSSSQQHTQVMDHESGILGLLAAKYIAHLRDRLGRNISSGITIGPSGRVTMCIDDRFHLPAHISCAWIIFQNNLFKPPSQPPCDLFQFAAGQISMQAFEAIRDRERFPLKLELVGAKVQEAHDTFRRLFSPESISAATSLFEMLSEYQERTEPVTHVDSAVLNSLLHEPITSRNYYFKVKLIDGWIWNLWHQDKPEEVRQLLLRSLVLFTSAPNTVQKSWVYALDPVLDVLEFLIYFHESSVSDERLAELYRDQYQTYFDSRYQDWLLRLTLGCGVGVFGMSFSRLRLAYTSKERDIGTEASTEFCKMLQSILGCSGSSFPDGNRDTKRYIERDWAHFRFSIFMREFTRGSIVHTTLGAMEFGGLQRDEGISTDTYEAEERKIKSAIEIFKPAVRLEQA